MSIPVWPPTLTTDARHTRSSEISTRMSLIRSKDSEPELIVPSTSTFD